jgi:hypothetical protein
MTVLYESGLAGAFMYMWGYQDALHNVPVAPGLLLNSQNTLDNLIGDLFGAISAGEDSTRRWFLAELKQDHAGFHDEVHGTKAKPHRTALYTHLRADKFCRDLARFGHFAVWYEEPQDVLIAPYAHAVGPGAMALPGQGFHELNHASFTSGFDVFYKNLHEPDLTRFYMNELLYGPGLGLPIEGMQAYLQCILQFCVPLPTTPALAAAAAAELIFGYVDRGGGAVLAKGTFEGLLASCAAFAATVTAPASPTAQGHSEDPDQPKS